MLTKEHKNLLKQYYQFAKSKLGFQDHPKVILVNDPVNAEKPLGVTGFYDPGTMTIKIYTTGRHVKDILRSLSHELVHHYQNCSGVDLRFSTSDINADNYLKQIELEAGAIGNTLLPKQFEEENGGYQMFENKIPKSWEYIGKKYDKSLKEWQEEELLKKITEKWGFSFKIPEPKKKLQESQAKLIKTKDNTEKLFDTNYIQRVSYWKLEDEKYLYISTNFLEQVNRRGVYPETMAFYVDKKGKILDPGNPVFELRTDTDDQQPTHEEIIQKLGFKII